MRNVFVKCHSVYYNCFFYVGLVTLCCIVYAYESVVMYPIILIR